MQVAVGPQTDWPGNLVETWLEAGRDWKRTALEGGVVSIGSNSMGRCDDITAPMDGRAGTGPEWTHRPEALVGHMLCLCSHVRTLSLVEVGWGTLSAGVAADSVAFAAPLCCMQP